MNQNEQNAKRLLKQLEEKPKSPVKKATSRRKRIIRILAIFGSFLMISGIIGSIICYLKAII